MWGQLVQLGRGMAAYAIVWPLGSVIQQKIGGGDLDWNRVARFSLYGSCYVAPTLFVWVRFSSKLFPGTGLRNAMKKAVVEQFTYGPFAVVSFFSLMTLLEGGTMEQATQEVKNKFLPTFKVGALVWPVAQTINFSLVPERNRIPYVAGCSLLWTSFLAYMKYLDEQAKVEEK